MWSNHPHDWFLFTPTCTLARTASFVATAHIKRACSAAITIHEVISGIVLRVDDDIDMIGFPFDGLSGALPSRFCLFVYGLPGTYRYYRKSCTSMYLLNIIIWQFYSTWDTHTSYHTSEWVVSKYRNICCWQIEANATTPWSNDDWKYVRGGGGGDGQRWENADFYFLVLLLSSFGSCVYVLSIVCAMYPGTNLARNTSRAPLLLLCAKYYSRRHRSNL